MPLNRGQHRLTGPPPVSTLHLYGFKDPAMHDVKVTQLRQNLPHYLARVGRGERVRVTSRGKVIAEISPPSASRKEVEAARARLRGSLLRYDGPFEPALGPGEWNVNKSL